MARHPAETPLYRSRTVVIDGAPIHTADFGGTGTPVVLVHGLGGSHVNWLRLAPELAKRARIVAMDLPGFGLSPVGHGVRFEDQVRAVTSFIGTMFGGERPVVVGASMGGAISATVANLRPDLVRGVALVCPALPGLGFGSRAAVLPLRQALAFATALGPGGDRVLRARLLRSGPERAVRDLLSLTCADSSRIPEAIVAAHVALAAKRSGQPWYGTAFRDAGRSMPRALARGGPVETALRNLSVPGVWAHGERDRIVPCALARETPCSPTLRLEILEGIGHVPQLESPAALQSLIEPLL
ncbi:MAG: alpha/beta hydrolase [Polyangiaceae bacterium]|nr:alpha/beta hydrolase [Polyangiaceae bacterium]